ncbi:MAG: hypothetical protein IT371_05075 [Deltaproteobacteria bacterium]|nr:hypothetical protein [Deltaproteobacteria bacterium]
MLTWRRWLAGCVLPMLLVCLASAERAPKPGPALESSLRLAPPQLTAQEARRFIDRVAVRENRFYQPGVGYDGRTGVTVDGVDIDFHTGRPVAVRNFSASSKESVHVALLVKALRGDRTAELMLSPDPRYPGRASSRALEVLTTKIATYERFNREYPGFGGFLPWYTLRDGRLVPIPSVREGDGWETRVPGLDNGQLAWSLYYAANALQELGHRDLARRYRAYLGVLSRNVVDIFYDPASKQLRAESTMVRGNRRPPSKNAYATNARNPYYLDDSYEGLLLCHFADLFGDWSKHPAGRDAIWATPRRKPGSYTTASGQKITIAKSWVGSSHEEWGELVLPFNALPLDRLLFSNAQRVRTAYSAEHGIPGLFASTHKPIAPTESPEYVGLAGFFAPRGTLERSRTRSIVAPYAAFPLALEPGGKPLFATWLKTMLDAPRMFGPLGMGESCSVTGEKIAPCLTWDGKALPMLAWMGGTRDELRRYLARDGKLAPFLARVEADYRLFDGLGIEGTKLPLRAPTAAVPWAISDFR